VLGCLVCKGGEPTPVLVCPVCALLTARVVTVQPALAKQASRNRPVILRRRPKRKKRK
jgi:hypothetical protein